MKTIAIIPAGGAGKRMGEEFPSSTSLWPESLSSFTPYAYFKAPLSSMKSCSWYRKGTSRMSGGIWFNDTASPRSVWSFTAEGRDRTR